MSPLQRLDVLVIGSGVAGLSAAVRLAQLGGARVGVITKGELEQSTTRWAQGGIAAVLPGDEDSTDLHLADTLRAGAGLCDQAAVRVLVDEGSERVHELIALGAVFDSVPGGGLSRAREGGHSTARVLHAGGTATGAEVERALVAAVRDSAAAILENWFALDLVLEGARCTGVVALDPSVHLQRVEASHVVLACGGAGQMYAVTTNPTEATGDGIAMALRAGVPVADVEFVQFHPTALHHSAMPRPLISEALRGHGAVLRDGAGNRFVDELLPRDLVSRAIAVKLVEEGSDHVWLDATVLEDFGRRFPTIADSLAEAGFDPVREWLPVAPAAHYLSGGVLVDLDGATALPGLWAAGEVACTGVHGANRLASNSMLEVLVFSKRIMERTKDGRSPKAAEKKKNADEYHLLPERKSRKKMPEISVSNLKNLMWDKVGIIRNQEGLTAAANILAAWQRGLPLTERVSYELSNMILTGNLMAEAALIREESRGAQFRTDFPETSDDWQHHIIFTNK